MVKHMNPKSKLLNIIGVFVLTATCSGQNPSDKKPLKHFAADILKVDSILSNISKHQVQRNGKCIRIKLIRIAGEWQESSIYPEVSEVKRRNERD
jgi:hypothetical protein